MSEDRESEVLEVLTPGGVFTTDQHYGSGIASQRTPLRILDLPDNLGNLKVEEDAPNRIAVAKASFIKPKQGRIFIPKENDLKHQDILLSDSTTSRRYASELALAVNDTGLFLTKEIEKALPHNDQTEEITTHIRLLFHNTDRDTYSHELAQRHIEQRTYFDKETQRKETYTITQKGALEHACTIIAAVAREKIWGEDISGAMIWTINELLTNYRLKSNVTSEYLPEMPDLIRELNDTLDTLDAHKGKTYLIRREIYNIFDQLPIERDEAERTLWTMDKDERDLAHPFALSATLHLERHNPTCEWVQEQHHRYDTVVALLETNNPNELFNKYDELAEVAQHIVIQPGSGTTITGKVGMELECSLSYARGCDLYHDWTIGGFSGTQEIRRSDTSLTYNSSYVHSLIPLSHFLRDRGIHFQGFHFHLDQITHPNSPTIGNMLTGLDESDRRVAIYDNPLNTWEVRGVWPPSVAWQQTRPSPADIAHIVNLHLLASIPPSEPTVPVIETDNSRISIHQAIFTHIVRHLQDPHARAAGLLALKHPLALNSVDIESIASNFNEESKTHLYKQFFHTDIRKDQKIICLSHIIPPNTVWGESEISFIQSNLSNMYSKDLKPLLRYLNSFDLIPTGIQSILWDAYEAVRTEIRLASSAVDAKQSHNFFLGSDEDKQYIRKIHALTSIKNEIKNALYTYADYHITDTNRILQLIQNPDLSYDVANDFAQVTGPRTYIDSLIALIQHENETIRKSAGVILNFQEVTDSHIDQLLEIAANNPDTIVATTRVLQQHKIPETRRKDILNALSASKNDQTKSAFIDLMKTQPLTEEECLHLMDQLHMADTSINQKIISVVHDHPMTDRIFLKTLEFIQTEISFTDMKYTDTCISLLIKDKNFVQKHQMELVKALSSSTFVDNSYIFYQAIKSTDLTPEAITHLTSQLSETGRFIRPFVSQLIVDESIENKTLEREIFQTIIPHADSNIVISLLSSYARKSKGQLSKEVIKQVKLLAHHTDYRVLEALLKLNETNPFADILSTEDVFSMLQTIDSQPEHTDMIPTKLMLDNKIKPLFAESVQSTPSNIKFEEYKTVIDSESRMPSAMQFRYSSVREHDQRTITKLADSKQVNFNEIAKTIYSDNMLNAPKPTPLQNKLNQSELDVRAVSSSDIRRHVISTSLNGNNDLSPAHCEYLLQKFTLEKYKDLQKSILIRLLSQRSLPDELIDRTFDLLDANPDFYRYNIRMVLQNHSPSPRYHERLWKIFQTQDESNQMEVLEYLTGHENIPITVLDNILPFLSHSNTNMASLAFRVFLRQPDVSDDILERAMQFCETPSNDLNPQAKVYDQFVHQKHLPERVLLWLIPDRFGGQTTFRHAENLVIIIKNQHTVPASVSEKIWYSAVKSYFNAGERVLKHLTGTLPIPDELAKTMIHYVDEAQNRELLREATLRLLVHRNPSSDSVIEHLFQRSQGYRDLDREIISTLAPNIKDPNILMRCLTPYLRSERSTLTYVFRELSRLDECPPQFIEKCIESYDGNDRYMKDVMLQFFAKQKRLTEPLIKRIVSIHTDTDTVAYNLQSYLLWRFSTNPIKSLIATMYGPDKYNYTR